MLEEIFWRYSKKLQENNFELIPEISVDNIPQIPREILSVNPEEIQEEIFERI